MKSWRVFVVHLVFNLFPATRCFLLKRLLLRWAGAKVGKGVRVVSSARFFINGNLTIGENTWIGHDVLIVGGKASVTIGKNVDIAPRVTIATGTHKLFFTPGRAAGPGYSNPITIEDGVWIGVNATVLYGVHVGKSSMIAAGALVKSQVCSGCVVGGIPAKVIRMPSC